MCPRSVPDYFGEESLNGGAHEREKIVKTIFNALNDEVKDCSLSLKYVSNQDCNTKESMFLEMNWTHQFLHLQMPCCCYD